MPKSEGDMNPLRASSVNGVRMAGIFRKHPIAGAVSFLGAVMTVGEIVMDGLELFEAGWPGVV
jgi:hypothetical protein